MSENYSYNNHSFSRKSQAPPVQLNDCIPAHSIEAEQSVLGSMLIEPLAIQRTLEILQSEDFHREDHGLLFAAIKTLFLSGQPADLVTVQEALRVKGSLAVITVPYLLLLFDTVPTAANVEYYAGIVKEKSLRRAMLNAALEIVALSRQEDEDIEALLDLAEGKVFALKQSGTASTGCVIGETIKAFEQKLDELSTNPSVMLGSPTGLLAYDEFTNGLQPGDLTIHMGGPGSGKSSLMTLEAYHVALTGRPVLIASCEMSREQLYVRMACEMASLDSFTLRRGRLDADEWGRYEEARKILEALPIYTDDRSSQSPGYIRSVARRVASEFGSLGGIFVDYIQLLEADNPTGNETADLGAIAYGLKNLARDMKLPVVALSQVNRGVESRDNKRPNLGDIRQSGKIAEAADVICGIYREEYYSQRGVAGLDTGRTQEVELLFLKQRNGAEGMVKVGFISRYTKFFDLPTSEGYAGLNDAEGPTGF